MTKLGTPSGEGPKEAKVAVGLALVGAPPWLNCEPPSAPSAAGRSPAVALGAVTPPLSVPPPRLWLRWTPPLGSSLASEACSGAPLWTLPLPGSSSSVVGAPCSAAFAFRFLGLVGGRFAVGVFEVGEAVFVVVDSVGAGRGLR